METGIMAWINVIGLREAEGHLKNVQVESRKEL